MGKIVRDAKAKVQARTNGYIVSIGFVVEGEELVLRGPEGFIGCDFQFLISLEEAAGLTVDEVIAEAWRRLDRLKLLL